MAAEGVVVKKEKAPLRQIRKMHFLIHPGYLGVHQGEGKAYDKLMDVYERHLSTLGEDEVVVIFTHVVKKHIKPHLKGEQGRKSLDTFARDQCLMQRIQTIAHSVGRRAIILSDSTNPFLPSAVTQIRRITNARGYTFDADTVTEAYGEILGACVDDAAENLNASGDFSKRTAIISALTDWGTATDKKGVIVKNLQDHKKSLSGTRLRLK